MKSLRQELNERHNELIDEIENATLEIFALRQEQQETVERRFGQHRRRLQSEKTNDDYEEEIQALNDKTKSACEEVISILEQIRTLNNNEYANTMAWLDDQQRRQVEIMMRGVFDDD